jgi:hypothetical protein
MTHLPDIRRERRTVAQRLAVNPQRRGARSLLAWFILAAAVFQGALIVYALLVVTL